MKLSVREAAVLLGVSPRAVRSKLARGEIEGKKQGNAWVIERRNLPLTDAQRRSLQRRADGLREALDAALPSRSAAHAADRRPSAAELAAVGLLLALRQALDEEGGEVPEAVIAALYDHIDAAIVELSVGFHQYDRTRKLTAFDTAREHAARAVGCLLLPAGAAAPDGWLLTLEKEILPAIGGLARRADQRGRR